MRPAMEVSGSVSLALLVSIGLACSLIRCAEKTSPYFLFSVQHAFLNAWADARILDGLDVVVR